MENNASISVILNCYLNTESDNIHVFIWRNYVIQKQVHFEAIVAAYRIWYFRALRIVYFDEINNLQNTSKIQVKTQFIGAW